MATQRRSFLKHVSLGAGALMLRPILDQLHAAEGKNPRKPWRVVFVLQSNGFHPWAAQPKELKITDDGPAKTVDLPLAEYTLPDDLAPLKNHQQMVTIVQRLQGTVTKPIHSGDFGALSGVLARRAAKARTIDAELAGLNPSTFPLVNLGVEYDQGGNPPSGDGLRRICSAWGPGRPIGTQVNPNLAYKALFGEAAKKIDEGGKLMDQIAPDVQRVQKQLTAAEREKFAKYLDVFETLDQRKELFQKAEQAPEPKFDPPAPSDNFASPLSAKQLIAQFELAAASLISGLTNVVTIASGACGVEGYFKGLGVDQHELHDVGHFESQGESWQSIYTKLRQFHFKLIADLIERLNGVSDPGGSSMMENTLIVYTSDGAETHHSKGEQWPFVLIGNVNDALRPGRFLEFPKLGQPGNRPINALYATLLQAVGQPAGMFNPPANANKEEHGPLAELLA